MKNGMPSFEWRPGLEVVDEYDEDREETLAIVNDDNEYIKRRNSN